MGGTYRYGTFYEDFAARLEKRMAEIIRPDTEIYVTGLPKMASIMAQSRFCEYYHNNQILNNALRAEKEGFDAFVMACPMDNVLKELREILDIPVVGIFQNACMTAMTLGYRFTAITGLDYLSERYRQMADSYGCGDRYLPNNYCIKMTRDEQYHSYDQIQEFRKNFIETARRAIDDGASVLLPFSNGVLSLAYASGLTKEGVDGVPVLDSVACAIKVAEGFADLKELGVHASRKIQVNTRISPEARDQIISIYKEGHKIILPKEQ